jgi:hypothetical protein
MNRFHVFGYVAAAGIMLLGIHQAQAQCSPIHHCSGQKAWNTVDHAACNGTLTVLGSDGSGTKFVGVSLQAPSGVTPVDGNISGLHNGAVLSGCAATDRTVDGQSVTSTTNCGSANGFGYSSDYCLN